MSLTEVARAIFYTDQTSGACAGMCACDRVRSNGEDWTNATSIKLSRHKLQDCLTLIWVGFLGVHFEVGEGVNYWVLPNIWRLAGVRYNKFCKFYRHSDDISVMSEASRF